MNTSLPRTLHGCAQLLLVIAVTVAGSTGRASPGDAPEAQVPEPVERCVSCHALTADEPALEGPTLWQVVGRPVASVPGFEYSDALESLGGVWTRERLDRFIAAPQAYAPGTLMELGGVRGAADRKMVLDFLETLRPGASTVRE
jgi:cytochrome c